MKHNADVKAKIAEVLDLPVDDITDDLLTRACNILDDMEKKSKEHQEQLRERKLKYQREYNRTRRGR